MNIIERLEARTTDDGLGDPGDSLINPDGPEAAALLRECGEAFGRIESEGQQSADTHGCANCNAHAEIARTTLAKLKGEANAD